MTTLRRLLLQAGAVTGILLASPSLGGAAVAQPVFLYSEPAVCVTPFHPVSGLTFHAGGAFQVVWFLPSRALGPVTYAGEPDPALDVDSTKIWRRPQANVTCYTDWFRMLPTPELQAQYRWHINYYGGTVNPCSGIENRDDLSPYSSEYDPYNPEPGYATSLDLDDDCSDGDGGDGDGTGGGDGDSDEDGGLPVGTSPDGGGTRSMCPDDAPFYWDIDCIDIYIEGVGWVEYWCGAVMVCG